MIEERYYRQSCDILLTSYSEDLFITFNTKYIGCCQLNMMHVLHISDVSRRSAVVIP